MALGLLTACGGGGTDGGDSGAPGDAPGQLVTLVKDVVSASGESDWKFDDGSPWTGTPGTMIGQVCTADPSKANLQLVLLGPASTDPAAAVAAVKGKLVDTGYTVSNEFAPKAGESAAHSVAAVRSDGGQVTYRVDSGGSSIGIETGCSDTIALGQAVTPAS